MSVSPVVARWAIVKREVLEQLKRNQPAPYSKFVSAIAIRTGLKVRTVVGYVDEFLVTGLVRLDLQNRLQLEEAAEVVLGYK